MHPTSTDLEGASWQNTNPNTDITTVLLSWKCIRIRTCIATKSLSGKSALSRTIDPFKRYWTVTTGLPPKFQHECPANSWNTTCSRILHRNGQMDNQDLRAQSQRQHAPAAATPMFYKCIQICVLITVRKCIRQRIASQRFSASPRIPGIQLFNIQYCKTLWHTQKLDSLGSPEKALH